MESEQLRESLHLVTGTSFCYDDLAGWHHRSASQTSVASVAKRSKAPVCGTGDHGFESHRSPQNLRL